MACLKKVSTIRLLKNGAKCSSIVVNDEKVAAGKLDASFYIYFDEMSLDGTEGSLIWVSFRTD